MPSISMERVIDALFLRVLDHGNRSNTDKLADGERLLQSIAEIYGLEHCAYLAFDKQSLVLRRSKTLLCYPSVWADEYRRGFSEQKHPLIIAGQTAVLPFEWNDLCFPAATASGAPEESSFHDKDKKGMSVPIRNQTEVRALFSVTGRFGDREWRDFKRNYLRDFVTLSQFLHKRISGETLEVDPMLSEREKEILQLCAMGLTSGCIAERLEVTVSTVKYFLNHVRVKMNVSNTTHAVAKGIKLGIIAAI